LLLDYSYWTSKMDGGDAHGTLKLVRRLFNVLIC
jgi:hypothetical protein